MRSVAKKTIENFLSLRYFVNTLFLHQRYAAPVFLSLTYLLKSIENSFLQKVWLRNNKISRWQQKLTGVIFSFRKMTLKRSSSPVDISFFNRSTFLSAIFDEKIRIFFQLQTLKSYKEKFAFYQKLSSIDLFETVKDVTLVLIKCP